MTQVSEPKTGVHRLSLRKNFSWALAGNFLYALCHLGILFVIQKLGSLEMLGAYSLALALCVPVFILTNLQLRTLQTTDSNREFDFSDYAGVRLLTTPLAVVVLLIICGFGHYSRETISVILAVAFTKVIETASELCYGAFQQHERLDYVSRSLCLKGLSSLGLIAITLFLTGNLVSALCFVSVGWFLIFLFHDFRHVYLLFQQDRQQIQNPTGIRFLEIWSLLRPRWNWSAIGKIFLCGLPLGTGALLLSATESLPNIFIEWNFGERELGIFTILVTLSFAGIPIVNALGQAVTPRLASNYANRNVIGFQQVLLKAVLLGTFFGLLLILGTFLFGKWMLLVCFGPEVAEYSGLLLVLMGLAPLKYGFRFFGNGLTATRQFAHVLRFQLFVLFVLVGLIVPLAAFGEMTGVAVAIILTTFIRVLLFVWQTRKELIAIAEHPAEVQFLAESLRAAKSLVHDFSTLFIRISGKWNSSNTLNSNSLKPGKTFPGNSEMTSVSSVKR
ncbi:MAG: oligosaccharide flippase family protein [Planctomycetaceae bacterium]|nr:oligosaccharide flippase family protein [Planctomycetaceae bacterium]